MTFVVTLIALLIERFFDWSHIRQWRWFGIFQQWCLSRIHVKSMAFVLAITVLIPVLIVALVQFLIHGLLYGFVKLVFELFILLACFGPQNLWADAFACMNALSNGDTAYAKDRLKNNFGITSAQSLHRQLLSHIFIDGYRRVFAIVFWFVVLGPVGAILYRTISVTAQDNTEHETPEAFIPIALRLQNILDWLPARLLTFLFALGGHFVDVLKCWRTYVFKGLDDNETLLTECGKAALGCGKRIADDGAAEQNAIKLLDRSFIITLVLIAIGVVLF